MGKFRTIPEKERGDIIKALEDARIDLGWDKKQMAHSLGIGYTHYIEIIVGSRNLSFGGVINAYKLGIPAKILLV